MRRSLAVALTMTAITARLAAAVTYVVDDAGDAPDANVTDGVCATSGGGCTLRAAIQQANTTAGADTITFAIPGDGVHVIRPVTDLPRITETVTIDGYTQPGAQPNTTATGALDAVPLIELDGTGSSHCIVLFNTGPATIRGLVIGGCGGAGVELGAAESNAVVAGNFIGTDATGTTAFPNHGGGVAMAVHGWSVGFTVGGTTPDARNLISGNLGPGIGASATLGSPIHGTVQGNLIGTDRTGTTALPNVVGIQAAGVGSATIQLVVGGTAAGAGNVVSGNAQAGIALGLFTAGAAVAGNLVGVAADGTGAVGNGADGVDVGDGPVAIGGTAAGAGNVVAHNGGAGVFVGGSAAGILVSGNAVFDNGGLGIDLAPPGPTQNDAGDVDTGPNGLQNFPVLAAGVFPGGTSVTGVLDSTPDTAFRIEVFANDVCDDSGYGEGQRFVGAADGVATDAGGHADFVVTFAAPLPEGTILAATAIAPDGSTSELSPCTETPPTTTTTTTSTTTTSTSTTTSTTSTTTTTATTSSSTTVTSASSTTTTATAASLPASSSSTTTTLPPDPCAAVVEGADFASILCRLQALLTDVGAGQPLGGLGPRLAGALVTARDRALDARRTCAGGSVKTSRRRLKQATLALGTYVARLKGRAGRHVDPERRRTLLAPVAGLRRDLATLGRKVACPAAAAAARAPRDAYDRNGDA